MTVGVGTDAEAITGEIGAGVLVFVGATHEDTDAEAAKLAAKIWNLRIFDDDEGVMNRSVAEGTGAVLFVSQFTLYADTRKGRRRVGRNGGRGRDPPFPGRYGCGARE